MDSFDWHYVCMQSDFFPFWDFSYVELHRKSIVAFWLKTKPMSIPSTGIKKGKRGAKNAIIFVAVQGILTQNSEKLITIQLVYPAFYCENVKIPEFVSFSSSLVSSNNDRQMQAIYRLRYIDNCRIIDGIEEKGQCIVLRCGVLNILNLRVVDRSSKYFETHQSERSEKETERE